MILDTSFLIALGNGDRGAFETGEELATSGEVQWLPAPVVGELEYGVEMAGTDEEKRRVRNACRLYPVVEIDAEIARRAGRLLARADRDAGGPGEAGVDDVDAMVAAVSEHLGDVVLTDNVRDFEALGVATETF
jgi:predicted nucleic acid-binding protein